MYDLFDNVAEKKKKDGSVAPVAVAGGSKSAKKVYSIVLSVCV